MEPITTEDAFVDITRWPYHIPSERQLQTVMLRGDPVPTPRPRLGAHGGTYMPRQYGVYKDSLGWALKATLTGFALDSVGSFGLRVVFFRRTRQRTDVDNLLKTCHDAGTGIVWGDDSQVIETFGRVVFDSPDPRVVMLIYRVDDIPNGAPLICVTCGKSFRLPPSQRHGRRYCSRACHHAGTQAKRIAHTCERCGVAFTVQASRRSPARFCSKLCNITTLREKRLAGHSPKLCSGCGARVSRREYDRCRACFLASR